MIELLNDPEVRRVLADAMLYGASLAVLVGVAGAAVDCWQVCRRGGR